MQPERDDVLQTEASEQLAEQGLDKDSVDAAIEAMRDAGMFDVPEQE